MAEDKTPQDSADPQRTDQDPGHGHGGHELDQALVARVQRGDSVAFDLLVRK